MHPAKIYFTVETLHATSLLHFHQYDFDSAVLCLACSGAVVGYGLVWTHGADFQAFAWDADLILEKMHYIGGAGRCQFPIGGKYAAPAGFDGNIVRMPFNADTFVADFFQTFTYLFQNLFPRVGQLSGCRMQTVSARLD